MAVEALGQALVAAVQVAGMEVVEEQVRALEAVGQDLVAAVDLEVVVEGSEAAEEQEREAEALELAGELELPTGKACRRENG